MSKEFTAFVLHKRAYQQHFELIDLLTDKYGCIRVIAKHYKKNRTLLQNFTRLSITISGNNELKKLDECDIQDRYREYSYETILLLTYMNELLLKLVPNESINLCEMYYYVLEHINNDSLNNQYLLRIFENHLLSELGFAIDFSYDIDTKPIVKNQSYNFIKNKGFKRSFDVGVSGQDILCFAKDKIPSSEGLLYYKYINQQRLAQLLDGRILQSRKLFKAFKAQNL